MTFKYRYRKQIIIGLIIILTISISSYGVYKIFSEKEDIKKEKVVVTNLEKTAVNKKKEQENVKEEVKTLMVDVKGNVINPGIYELEDGKRVVDAINKAGGLNEIADTSVLNLSKKLKDEMVIIVYSYEDVLNFTIVKEQESVKQEECVKGINDIENDACIDEENNTNNGKVSINTASIEELMQLDGIGESKAKAIIEYREKNGNFEAIEDLLKVNGIGENLFAKIKENITL